MTSNPTPEEIRASIVPKSDQLNADDLVAGPITVKIVAVKKGDREQPINVEVEGQRPYKPCKTMRRVLIAVYGDDPKEWIGHSMRLYCDPEVKFGGVKVGGIRISHLSGLAEPKTFLLTQTRGKKSEVTIFPLEEIDSKEKYYIESARKDICQADSLEVLKAIGFILAEKPKTIQDALRQDYAKRYTELQA